MKGKGNRPAKLSSRAKAAQAKAAKSVAIEYFELTTSEVGKDLVTVRILRLNHGVVEAAGKCCQDLIGHNRAALESYIVQCEEKGVDVSLRSLVGINYMRLSYPSLDAQLVHGVPEITE